MFLLSFLFSDLAVGPFPAQQLNKGKHPKILRLDSTQSTPWAGTAPETNISNDGIPDDMVRQGRYSARWICQKAKTKSNALVDLPVAKLEASFSYSTSSNCNIDAIAIEKLGSNFTSHSDRVCQKLKATEPL